MDLAEIRTSIRSTLASLPIGGGDRYQSQLMRELEGSGEAHVARGPGGTLAILVRCSASLQVTEKFAGISMGVELLAMDGRDPSHFLVLECEPSTSENFFVELVSAVADTAQREGRTPDFALTVRDIVLTWGRMLERLQDKDIDARRAAGALAELLTVDELLSFGASADLKFWLGPDSMPHDIAIAGHALEVKAKTTTSPTVTINGLHQLREIPSQSLHLVVYQVLTEDGPLKIGSVVDAIVGKGVPYFEMLGRLANIGMSPQSGWWLHGMTVESISMFGVEGDFPRITIDVLSPEIDSRYLSEVKYAIPIAGRPTVGGTKSLAWWWAKVVTL
jgi:hypothetical protein